jgi:hypothetical protein
MYQSNLFDRFSKNQNIRNDTIMGSLIPIEPKQITKKLLQKAETSEYPWVVNQERKKG